MQYERNGFGCCNSRLQLEHLYAITGDEAKEFILGIKDSASRFSTRRLIRTLRIARTIADIVGIEKTNLVAMHKALSYSQVDLVQDYTAEVTQQEL